MKMIVNKYLSADKKYLLEVPELTLTPVESYIQKAGKKETGGIIIGRYSDELDKAIVAQFTDAPVDSLAGFFWFIRGNHGLKCILEKLWSENLYYLGEWHFHPFAEPTPSNQDIKQIRKIAHSPKYRCPEPLLVIFGGSPDNYSIRAFIYPKSNGFIELHSI